METLIELLQLVRNSLQERCIEKVIKMNCLKLLTEYASKSEFLGK